MIEEDMPDWRQQEECEQQRFEEEQALLAADPDYARWLETLDGLHQQESGEVDDRGG